MAFQIFTRLSIWPHASLIERPLHTQIDQSKPIHSRLLISHLKAEIVTVPPCIRIHPNIQFIVFVFFNDCIQISSLIVRVEYQQPVLQTGVHSEKRPLIGEVIVGIVLPYEVTQEGRLTEMELIERVFTITPAKLLMQFEGIGGSPPQINDIGEPLPIKHQIEDPVLEGQGYGACYLGPRHPAHLDIVVQRVPLGIVAGGLDELAVGLGGERCVFGGWQDEEGVVGRLKGVGVLHNINNIVWEQQMQGGNRQHYQNMLLVHYI